MENTIFIIDDFVSVRGGEPFRLLPFGVIVKNGKKHTITKEFASKFSLPHFKPPVKLGSHEDVTPAGGFIVGLEVREDGLYAIPEWNDAGNTAMVTGSYRYHSPEIIWEGGFEHPETGEMIEAPLIVGDALLHTPHLGEATAFYSVEPIKNTQKKDGVTMSENVTIPVSFWDKLTARLFEEPKTEPEPQKTHEPEQEDYSAKVTVLSAENEQLKADLDKFKAEQELQSKVEKFGAEFKETPVADNADLFSVLAKLGDDDAAVITKELKALSEQAKLANLDKNLGGSGDNSTPIEKYNAAISAKTANGMNIADAIAQLATEQPDLIAKVRKVQGGK